MRREISVAETTLIAGPGPAEPADEPRVGAEATVADRWRRIGEGEVEVAAQGEGERPRGDRRGEVVAPRDPGTVTLDQPADTGRNIPGRNCQTTTPNGCRSTLADGPGRLTVVPPDPETFLTSDDLEASDFR
jgi:hypothetical protein